MATKNAKIDKIEHGVEHIFAKSDARVESGCDPVQADWQALIGRIAVEIDLNFENLDGLKGVKMPDRNIKDPKYNRIFDETTRRLYEIIVGRECPKSVKVM